ncbi:MAG: type II secretion system F family protein [Candidatus Micrarchaeota archaeon]
MGYEKVPVLLFSRRTAVSLGRRLSGLGNFLFKAFPRAGENAGRAGLGIEPGAYLASSAVSSLAYGLLFTAVGLAAISQKDGLDAAYGPAAGIGLSMWAVFFMLHVIYPGIIVKKIAAKESKDLLFALREIMMSVESGVPLFDAMKNVGDAGYGYVSRDFAAAMREVEGGMPETESLKRLALRTESEYMKRALWQIVSALESGARMESTLGGIVESLEGFILRDIKNYSTNLNFLMLLYLLGAAVVPSLGITFLILLSAFGGLGVTLETVVLLIGASVGIQLVMIGYMSATRPEVFGG